MGYKIASVPSGPSAAASSGGFRNPPLGFRFKWGAKWRVAGCRPLISVFYVLMFVSCTRVKNRKRGDLLQPATFATVFARFRFKFASGGFENDPPSRSRPATRHTSPT